MSKDRELTRRRLLILGAAASASAAVGPRTAEAQAKPSLVPRRVLGKTKQSVPILLLGGGMGFKGGVDRRIEIALRYGVNYIDTARKYAGGRSEPNAAATLHKLEARDKTWITSKSAKWTAQGFAQDVVLSLDAMKTSLVDLYLLHQLDDEKPLDDRELIKTVERLKNEGKIRFFGFSCHSGNVAELLHAAAKRSFIDVVMFSIQFP